MKKSINILLLFLVVAFASCKKEYRVISIESSLIVIDSTFDVNADAEMLTILDNYKQQIDSIMNRKLAVSEMSMSNGTPQSLLANFTADVLRESGVDALGKKADFAVMNNGGLRTSLPDGNVTVGDIFKIYPFENEVFYLKIKGSDVTALFEAIAKRGGEGVAGCNMVIKDRALQSLKIGGKEIDSEAYYWCATIDYLAEGNSGIVAMRNATEIVDSNILLRDLMMSAVKTINESNKKITSKVDDRILVLN